MLNKFMDAIDAIEEKGQEFVSNHPVITLSTAWCSYLVVVGLAGKFYHDRAVETRKLAKAITAANVIMANQNYSQ